MAHKLAYNLPLGACFSVDGKVPKPMLRGLLGVLRKNATFGQLAADGWKAYRSL